MPNPNSIPGEHIPLHFTKTEILRFDNMLTGNIKNKCYLIGGLAVAQYRKLRQSTDIDLICSCEDNILYLLDQAYPSQEWDSDNANDDDRRPTYTFIRKDNSNISVIYGLKYKERGGYITKIMELIDPNVCRPFQYNGQVCRNIFIPKTEVLVLTKFMSHIGRYKTNKTKSLADLDDIINLSNEKDFNFIEFNDIFYRYKENEKDFFNGFEKSYSENKGKWQESKEALSSIFPNENSRINSQISESPIPTPSDSEHFEEVNKKAITSLFEISKNYLDRKIEIEGIKFRFLFFKYNARRDELFMYAQDKKYSDHDVKLTREDGLRRGIVVCEALDTQKLVNRCLEEEHYKNYEDLSIPEAIRFIIALPVKSRMNEVCGVVAVDSNRCLSERVGSTLDDVRELVTKLSLIIKGIVSK
jgi:hypothetical protein